MPHPAIHTQKRPPGAGTGPTPQTIPWKKGGGSPASSRFLFSSYRSSGRSFPDPGIHDSIKNAGRQVPGSCQYRRDHCDPQKKGHVVSQSGCHCRLAQSRIGNTCSTRTEPPMISLMDANCKVMAGISTFRRPWQEDDGRFRLLSGPGKQHKVAFQDADHFFPGMEGPLRRSP